MYLVCVRMCPLESCLLYFLYFQLTAVFWLDTGRRSVLLVAAACAAVTVLHDGGQVTSLRVLWGRGGGRHGGRECAGARVAWACHVLCLRWWLATWVWKKAGEGKRGGHSPTFLKWFDPDLVIYKTIFSQNKDIRQSEKSAPIDPDIDIWRYIAHDMSSPGTWALSPHMYWWRYHPSVNSGNNRPA